MAQRRVRRELPEAFQVGGINAAEHGDNLFPHLAGHAGILDQHHLDAVRLKAADSPSSSTAPPVPLWPTIFPSRFPSRNRGIKGTAGRLETGV
jgi:hypothetical protein